MKKNATALCAAHARAPCSVAGEEVKGPGRLYLDGPWAAGSVNFHPAASSPSRRRVRHLVLPRAFTNFVERRFERCEACEWSDSCNCGQPEFVTTVLPTTTALQAKRRASSGCTSISWGTWACRAARLEPSNAGGR